VPSGARAGAQAAELPWRQAPSGLRRCPRVSIYDARVAQSMKARHANTSKAAVAARCDAKASGQLVTGDIAGPSQCRQDGRSTECPSSRRSWRNWCKLIDDGHHQAARSPKIFLPELLEQGGFRPERSCDPCLGMISDPAADHGDRGGAAGGPFQNRGGGVPEAVKNKACRVLRGPS